MENGGFSYEHLHFYKGIFQLAMSDYQKVIGMMDVNRNYAENGNRPVLIRVE